jgi:Flp pilus assembly pilin Flp
LLRLSFAYRISVGGGDGLFSVVGSFRQLKRTKSSAFQIRKLWQANDSAVATEYAFVVAFIAIVAAVGMVLMGENLSSFFNRVGAGISEITCTMPSNASDKGKGNSNKCKDKDP